MKRAACLTLIAVVSVAASADAATTIGRTTGSSNCNSPMTVFQQALPGGGIPTSAPGPGVITYWSYHTPMVSQLGGSIELKVGRVSGSQLTIVGESDRVTLTTPGTPEFVDLHFPTRISVQAGDIIGLFVVDHAPCHAGPEPGAIELSIAGAADLQPGQTSPFTTSDVAHVNVEATFEPDADNDGFGDETQDTCPGSAGPTGGCDRTAPDTTLTEQPKRKSGKRKARFAFTASEAGSSFECSLDGRAFAPCPSPTKTKRLKLLTHRFQVRAIDAVGNVDDTPALAEFKVKKKPTK